MTNFINELKMTYYVAQNNQWIFAEKKSEKVTNQVVEKTFLILLKRMVDEEDWEPQQFMTELLKILNRLSWTQAPDLWDNQKMPTEDQLKLLAMEIVTQTEEGDKLLYQSLDQPMVEANEEEMNHLEEMSLYEMVMEKMDESLEYDMGPDIFNNH